MSFPIINGQVDPLYLLVQKVDQLHNLLAQLDQKILYLVQQQQILNNKILDEPPSQPDKTNKRFCGNDRFAIARDDDSDDDFRDRKRKVPSRNISQIRREWEKEETERNSWLAEEKIKWHQEQEETRLKMEAYRMSYIN